MNVLICMEESQTIQQAFARRGHNAWSVDLKPGRVDPSHHVQGDVFEVAWEFCRRWNGQGIVILHPVCRYLSVSGQHWIGRPGHEDRAQHRDDAISDFLRCVDIAQAFTAGIIENPRGVMSRRYRRPDQTVQPYNFGDDASKTTDFWQFGAAADFRLEPTKLAPPRMVCQGSCRQTFVWRLGDSIRVGRCMNCGGKLLPRWANQTDSGQNRLGPTADPEDRRAARATTYAGIADALAEQLGTVA